MAIQISDIMSSSSSAATSLLDDVMAKAKAGSAIVAKAAAKAEAGVTAATQPLQQKGMDDLYAGIERQIQQNIQRQELVRQALGHK